MPLSAFASAEKSLSELGLKTRKIGESKSELPPNLVRAIEQNGGDPTLAIGFEIPITPITLNGKKLTKPAVQTHVARVLVQTTREKGVLLAYVLHKGDLLAAFAVKK